MWPDPMQMTVESTSNGKRRSRACAGGSVESSPGPNGTSEMPKPMQDHIENRMEGVPWQRVELSQRQRVRQKTIKRIKSLTIWAGGCNLPGHGKDPATIEVLAGWDSDKQLDSVWALHLTSAEARS